MLLVVHQAAVLKVPPSVKSSLSAIPEGSEVGPGTLEISGTQGTFV